MVTDWYSSVGEDVMLAASLDETELTDEVLTLLRDYWTSLDVVFSAFRDFPIGTHTTDSALSHELRDWIQQVDDEQFWSEVRELYLSPTTLTSASTALEAPSVEPGQISGAFLSSVPDTNNGNHSGVRKRKRSASPPARWVRRSSPVSESSTNMFAYSMSSAEELASSSSFMEFNGWLDEHSNALMPPSTSSSNLQGFNQPYRSSFSVSTGSTSTHQEQEQDQDQEQEQEQEHIRRPLNSFFLFRQDYRRNYPTSTFEKETNLSKAVGIAWSNLTPAERQHWKTMADEAKEKHDREHPGYRYRTKVKSASKGKRRKGKRRKDAD